MTRTIRTALPLALGAALALGALGACDKSLDEAQAEKAIFEHFSKAYKVSVVKCPSNIKLQKDTKFDCALTFEGSDTVNVGATITSVESDGGHFDFHITDAVFDPQPTAAYLVDELNKQGGAGVKVDCGLPRKPKPEETCTVTAADGTTAKAVLVVGTDGKPTRYDIK